MGNRSPESTIGTDAILQYFGSGAQLFSGLIFFVLVARMFDTKSVGLISLLVAILGLLNVIFSFGLGLSAKHYISYYIGLYDYSAVKRIMHRIILFSLILSVSGMFILFISAPFISVLLLHSSEYSGLIRFLGIVLMGYVLFSTLNGSLLGLQSFKLSSIVNMFVWTLYYLGGIALAIYIHSVTMIIAGWAIGMLLGVTIEITVIMKKIASFGDKTSLKVSNRALFSYSFPILMSGIIGYGAAYADRLIVAGMMNLYSLGIYNIALLISSSVGFVSIPFNNMLTPKFSEYFGNGRKSDIAGSVGLTTMLLNSLYIPGALGVGALSSMVMHLIGGPSYESGASSLTIVMVISAIFISRNILTQAMAAVKQTRALFIASSAALATNIVITVTLIPLLGITGAALGFSSVYVANFVILYIYSKREGVMSYDMRGNSVIWMASIAMFVVIKVMEKIFGLTLINLPTYIIIGLLTYLLLIKLLRAFQKESQDIIISLFPQKFKRIRTALSFFIR